MMLLSEHKAGFIHLLGKPNAGKSTLFNALIDRPLAITGSKAQTTRHNLLGIQSKEGYQAIFVDTPGHIQPHYALQAFMMRALKRSVSGSDLLCWVVDIKDTPTDELLPAWLEKGKVPWLVILNKIDLVAGSRLVKIQAAWQACLPARTVLHAVSARKKLRITQLAQELIALLPDHPPYYDRGLHTDRPLDFFIAEIIRKAIFFQYRQEIPYSTQVRVTHLAQEKALLRIEVSIYVERTSQKQILIGRGGGALSKVGTMARKALEDELQQKVFVLLRVKVMPDWRKRPSLLEQWGYA